MQEVTAHLHGTKKRMLGFSSAVAILFALFLLPINPAWAKTYRILIVSSGSSAVYTKVIDTIQNTVTSSTALSKNNTNVKFDVFFLKNTSTTEQLQGKAKKQDLLLIIGQRAMISATQIDILPPTVTTLIPKQSYDKYRSTFHKINKKSTAIFIDNPLDRQILLAKILLGSVQKLGVLTGENPPHSKSEIKAAIQKHGVKAHIETIKKNDNLIRRLSDVLSDSDAFIALPDAHIFNRRTAKNILLTTYRHRTPVIAYSASYVKAGALAAAYSTPQQIAEQTAHTLVKIFTSKSGFPQKDAYPNDFKVSINKNVAKSLGIPIISESTLKNKLLKLLRRKK